MYTFSRSLIPHRLTKVNTTEVLAETTVLCTRIMVSYNKSHVRLVAFPVAPPMLLQPPAWWCSGASEATTTRTPGASLPGPLPKAHRGFTDFRPLPTFTPRLPSHPPHHRGNPMATRPPVPFKTAWTASYLPSSRRNAPTARPFSPVPKT